MGVPSTRIVGRWQRLTLFLAMMLFLIDGVFFSYLLTRGISADGWRLAIRVLGMVVAVAVFGTLAIQALRIGLYADAAGILIVRSIGVTRFVPLDSKIEIAPYYGHSSHGGRFYAPEIRVTTEASDPRSIRLWWLASFSEDTGRRWTADVRAFVNTARDRQTPAQS